MKYWSFWYFWSIFILISATMCNINTQIPVYQRQRSHAEQDHRTTAFCWLQLHVLLHPWLGQWLWL